MKQKNRYVFDMLDLDSPEATRDAVYRAGKPVSAREEGGSAVFTVPFFRQELRNMFLYPVAGAEPTRRELVVRAYGDSIVRLTLVDPGCLPDDSDNPMLEFHPSLAAERLEPKRTDDGWVTLDSAGRTRMAVKTRDVPEKIWSDLQPEPREAFEATVYPDGETAVPFMARDDFFPHQSESISLATVRRDGATVKCAYSLHAAHDEKFAGTGERFAGMNLAGRTFLLENTDGLGVNSRRAYKNVPFYVSSRGYGLLVMTSSSVKLSLSDISSRASQGVAEDGTLDLFFVGGGDLERVVRNYRKVTGFPADVPLWSYGTWMSKMTYFSADETRDVVAKMRAGRFPCDVIHIDTGWFRTDWKCEWEFNPETFPDPESYFREMEGLGIKISLWQLPCIAKGTKYYDVANENRYVAPKSESVSLGSNFSDVEFDGAIDFTNPEAAAWYGGLLERLLRMGAAAIKTDFGEAIEPNADYFGMPYERLHNLYGLLYQREAYAAARKVKGPENALIWARAGWTGCQRYPLHWGGDCACSWDGMAGSLRGGLHLGVSGFAFWSHDVPGFHGVPSFMNSRPADDLYVRWTQMGVFTSHLRYHGTNEREPYEYPAIADIARKWLNLRYALVPYLAEQGRAAVASGYPTLRALLFHHFDDPACWSIDDEFYCGDAFLVAPVMNSEGVRDVYLPAGEWVDFWTGERRAGPAWLKGVESPLERMPVFARYGASVPVYPDIVQSTKDMDPSRVATISFDGTYRGLAASVIGKNIAL